MNHRRDPRKASCRWNFAPGRKRYARSVNTVGVPKKKPRYKELITFREPVTFSEEDMKGVNFSYFDTITIIANVKGAEVQRILVGK